MTHNTRTFISFVIDTRLVVVEQQPQPPNNLQEIDNSTLILKFELLLILCVEKLIEYDYKLWVFEVEQETIIRFV